MGCHLQLNRVVPSGCMASLEAGHATTGVPASAYSSCILIHTVSCETHNLLCRLLTLRLLNVLGILMSCCDVQKAGPMGQALVAMHGAHSSYKDHTNFAFNDKHDRIARQCAIKDSINRFLTIVTARPRTVFSSRKART